MCESDRRKLVVMQLKRMPALLVVAMVAFAGCGAPAELTAIASPDGTMTLTPSVNQSKADQTKYLCVAFDIHDAAGGLLHSVQSGASAIQKWAIAWFDDSTIVLYSSDIGTYAWKLADDGTIAKLPHPLPAKLNGYGDHIKAAKDDR